MNWKDIVLFILIPIGIVQVLFRWLWGIALCRVNEKRRIRQIGSTTTKIKGMYLEDFAKRGLSRSGRADSSVSVWNDNKKDLIARLKVLKWFGNDAESERIVDNLENEQTAIETSLEQKAFHYKLNDNIETIKIIFQNSEALQSPMQKKLGSRR